jgi:Protein of unknown function (DUF1572)
MSMPREIVGSIEREYRRYKGYAEGTFDQLTDEQLALVPAAEGNSVAILVWHVSGNLKSRFTDFLTTDGEKPWRHRDSEFDERAVTREQLLQKWNEGFAVLFAALATLQDADLGGTITIRDEALKVHEALHRSLAHTSSHVGQIVLLGKTMRAATWRTLTLPRARR